MDIIKRKYSLEYAIDRKKSSSIIKSSIDNKYVKDNILDNIPNNNAYNILDKFLPIIKREDKKYVLRYKNFMNHYYWFKTVFIPSCKIYTVCERNGEEILVRKNEETAYDNPFDDSAIISDSEIMETYVSGSINIGKSVCITNKYGDLKNRYSGYGTAKTMYEQTKSYIENGSYATESREKEPPYIDLDIYLGQDIVDEGQLTPYIQEWEPKKKYLIGDEVYYSTGNTVEDVNVYKAKKGKYNGPTIYDNIIINGPYELTHEGKYEGNKSVNTNIRQDIFLDKRFVGKRISVSCYVEFKNNVSFLDTVNNGMRRAGFEFAVRLKNGKSDYFGAWRYYNDSENNRKKITKEYIIPNDIDYISYCALWIENLKSGYCVVTMPIVEIMDVDEHHTNVSKQIYDEIGSNISKKEYDNKLYLTEKTYDGYIDNSTKIYSFDDKSNTYFGAPLFKKEGKTKTVTGITQSLLTTLRRKKTTTDDNGNALDGVIIDNSDTSTFIYDFEPIYKKIVNENNNGITYLCDYIENITFYNGTSKYEYTISKNGYDGNGAGMTYSKKIRNYNMYTNKVNSVSFTYHIDTPIYISKDGKITGRYPQSGITYSEKYNCKCQQLDTKYNGSYDYYKIVIGDRIYDDTENETNYNEDLKKNSQYPIFSNISYTTSNAKNFFDLHGFKDDSLLGVVDTVNDINVNIERGMAMSFERHNALSEIKTMNDLENYRNGGFFTIDDTYKIKSN